MSNPLNTALFKSGLMIALWVGSALSEHAWAESPADAQFLDGSFRFSDGTILTGGRFVEGDNTYYLYLDTDHPSKGGLFQPGDTKGMLKEVPIGSKAKPSLSQIRFAEDDDGNDVMIWRRGDEEVSGQRVFPHHTTAVDFKSADGTLLEGRLLTPHCSPPHPTIITVHGSGRANRFGGTYDLFFVRQGMAVFAYDKRGYSDDTTAWREPDLNQLSADATAAVRAVANRPEIDANRIGLIGNSQGGWTTPPAAIDARETDFLIVRAGPVLSHADTMVHERRQEWRAEGMQGIALDNATDLLREIYRMAGDGHPITSTDKLVQPFLDRPWYKKAFGDQLISKSWSADWWAWAGRNIDDDSLGELREFRHPVLWFLAEADENVPVVPNYSALKLALAESPGTDHTVSIINDAPHSFLVTDADGKVQLSDRFFSKMAQWLADRNFSESSCWDGSPRSRG